MFHHSFSKNLKKKKKNSFKKKKKQPLFFLKKRKKANTDAQAKVWTLRLDPREEEGRARGRVVVRVSLLQNRESQTNRLCQKRDDLLVSV